MGDIRKCDHCGRPMISGYVVGDMIEDYYCSDECFFQNHTKKQYAKMYEEELAYWTSWAGQELVAEYSQSTGMITISIFEGDVLYDGKISDHFRFEYDNVEYTVQIKDDKLVLMHVGGVFIDHCKIKTIDPSWQKQQN